MKRLIFACLFLLMQIGCATSPSSNPGDSGSVQPAEQAKVPNLILSFTGSGDLVVGVSSKITQSFHISKNEWFIETDCSSLDPTLQIFFSVAVYPQGELIDDNYIGQALQTSPGTAINYIHKAGDFYLSINAMNVREWSVKIFQ